MYTAEMSYTAREENVTTSMPFSRDESGNIHSYYRKDQALKIDIVHIRIRVFNPNFFVPYHISIWILKVDFLSKYDEY
jgi:hypothetical protein